MMDTTTVEWKFKIGDKVRAIGTTPIWIITSRCYKQTRGQQWNFYRLVTPYLDRESEAVETDLEAIPPEPTP